MLKPRGAWRANQDTRAKKHLTELEGTVVALSDDDLLDLADIFEAAPPSILKEIAAREMARRGISL
ncbi:hypothetical protein PK98_14550 [Croceibacterium mercuriale]|uniref:Uncharacterized protein n=1 Tax=Croceibacterium mercuriale TaxID=1572751 RepID=A0A0B2BX62_9SPHN|nr:hypothetical protein PK98_14550 [Croceibacterium mercuriale]